MSGGLLFDFMKTTPRSPPAHFPPCQGGRSKIHGLDRNSPKVRPAAEAAHVVLSDVGADHAHPLRPGLPRVRALPGDVRPVARAPSGELRPALRRSDLFSHASEYSIFFINSS